MVIDTGMKGPGEVGTQLSPKMNMEGETTVQGTTRIKEAVHKLLVWRVN